MATYGHAAHAAAGLAGGVTHTCVYPGRAPLAAATLTSGRVTPLAARSCHGNAISSRIASLSCVTVARSAAAAPELRHKRRCLAAAWQRLGRLRRRRSSASSRARLRALLQLLRRSFLQPPLRPREQAGGFLDHHHFSTKTITVRQEHVDETSIYASAGRRVQRSRARGLSGGGAKPAISIFDLPAFERPQKTTSDPESIGHSDNLLALVKLNKR